jgi:MFS family permease
MSAAAPDPGGAAAPDPGGAAATAGGSHVVRSYLAIVGIYTLSASLIWGVNTLFLLDAGLDIFEVFIANAAFTAGMVIFEIPTGVVADTVGRRVSFLLSTVVLLGGTIAYVAIAAADGGLVPFIAASVVLGLGFTFYSGAVEAWLVDALAASGYEGELDRVFARGAMVSGGAMLLGTLGGGALGTVDLALPFVARSVLLALAFVVAWFVMHDEGFERRSLRLGTLPAELSLVARAGIRYGWSVRPVRWLYYLSFVQYAFFVWGFYAWQPYLLELLDRDDVIWVAGAVAAGLSLATIAGNSLVELLARPCGRRTTLLLPATALLAAATVGIGLVDSFVPATALLMLVGVSMGVLGPVQQAFLHGLVPSAQRATVVSLGSMVGSGGSVLGQTGLGLLAREQSISSGYVVGGAISFAALPVLWVLRRMNSTADGIADSAGTSAACAAQGLPVVVGVDALARGSEHDRTEAA